MFPAAAFGEGRVPNMALLTSSCCLGGSGGFPQTVVASESPSPSPSIFLEVLTRPADSDASSRGSASFGSDGAWRLSLPQSGGWPTEGRC